MLKALDNLRALVDLFSNEKSKDEDVSPFVSAFELEARILYSASPIDVAEPTAEPAEVGGGDWMDSDPLAEFAPMTAGDHAVAAAAATAVQKELLFATSQDGDADGVTWLRDDAVRFGDPNLNLGSSTDGTFSVAFDLDAFASGFGTLSINALHSVQDDITIGTGANTFDLEVGDLIFTIEGFYTFTGNTTSASGNQSDVFVFRPDALGNYSSGEFYELFDQPFGFTGVFDGISLVDKPGGVTLPSGVTIPEGTFFYSLFNSSDIRTFVATSAGAGGTDVTSSAFITGADSGFSIDENVNGLHFVQDNISLGGIDFEEGDLLIAIEEDDSVGSPSTGVKPEDIALLRLNGDGTSASGTKVFDGSKVDLSSGDESLEAITFAVSDAAPKNISIDSNSIDENTDTSSAVTIGTLSSSDGSPGSVSYQVIGAAPFSVVSGDQLVITGESLDFETTPAYSVVIRATDSVGLFSERTITINVNDVNEAPTVQLVNRISFIPESQSSQTKIGDIVVTDDALGAQALSLSGPDASKFQIVGSELFLIANAGLDFEIDPLLNVVVNVDDASLGGGIDDFVAHALAVTDVNEAPTVSLTNVVTSIPENSNNTSRIKIANIVVSDDALGSETLSLTGADSSDFEILGTELFLRSGTLLDHENTGSYSVVVNVDDTSIGAGPDDSVSQIVIVADVNESPSVSLANRVTSVSEATTAQTKIADIVITDDALGTESLRLSGANSSLFEIIGNELFLRANSAIDFETDNILEVVVSVDDTTIGSSADDSVDATVAVTNDNEAPVVASPLGSVNVIEDASALSIDLSSTFADADLDPLTLSLGVVSDTSIATARISGNSLIVDFVADQSGAVTIQVNASDGSLSVTDTLTVNIAPANDAPILSGDATLNDIYRGEIPSGELLQDYVPTLVSDVDLGDSPGGIAIVSNPANAADGQWQFFDSLNNTWRDIGAASSTSSVLLTIDTEIRFFPAAGFTGVPAPLDFVAIDSSYTGPFSGTTIATADTSTRGGTSAFSNSVGQLGILVRDFGISVTPVTSLTTTEAGATAVFEVVLDGPPTGDVTISVSSSDVSEGTVSTNQLRFDTSNWSTPQRVTIQGVDDLNDDGNQSYSVELGPASSTDPKFDGINLSDVVVINSDDDGAVIEVSKSRIVTSESGSTDEFSVRLSSQPTSAVILSVESSNASEVTLSASSLTFTPSNWNVLQTITVTGIDDNVRDSDKTFQVLVRPTTSADPAFAALTPVEIDAENTANDLGPVIIPDEKPIETEEEKEAELLPIGPSVVDREDSEGGANVVANKPTEMVETKIARPVIAELEGSFILASHSTELEDQRSMFANRVSADFAKATDADLVSVYKSGDYSQLWLNLNELDQQIENQSSLPQVAAGTVASVASVFTVGYLAWLVRGGQLFLALLSQMPAWSSLDLLTVLAVAEDEEDEGSSSLESLVTSDVDEMEDHGKSEEVTITHREAAQVS